MDLLPRGARLRPGDAAFAEETTSFSARLKALSSAPRLPSAGAAAAPELPRVLGGTWMLWKKGFICPHTKPLSVDQVRRLAPPGGGEQVRPAGWLHFYAVGELWPGAGGEAFQVEPEWPPVEIKFFRRQQEQQEAWSTSATAASLCLFGPEVSRLSHFHVPSGGGQHSHQLSASGAAATRPTAPQLPAPGAAATRPTAPQLPAPGPAVTRPTAPQLPAPGAAATRPAQHATRPRGPRLVLRRTSNTTRPNYMICPAHMTTALWMKQILGRRGQLLRTIYRTAGVVLEDPSPQTPVLPWDFRGVEQWWEVDAERIARGLDAERNIILNYPGGMCGGRAYGLSRFVRKNKQVCEFFLEQLDMKCVEVLREKDVVGTHFYGSSATYLELVRSQQSKAGHFSIGRIHACLTR